MDPNEGRFDEMVSHFLTMEEETPFSLLLNDLVAWAEAPADGWFLDVGAGPGGLLRRLGSRKAVSVDLSFPMCRKSKELGNLAVQADALHLPLRDEAFDAAFATNLLHLVGDPLAALREVRRVMMLGAPFLCVVPGPRMSEASLVAYLEERHGPATAEFLSGWGRSADANRRFSHEDLSDLLYAAQFSDVQTQGRWDDLALIAKAIR